MITEDRGPALSPTPSRLRRGWWKLPALAGAVCVAGFELRGHLPSPASTWAALRHASVTWLIVAAALHLLSVVAFAEQERRLLRAFGVRMAPRLAVAMTFARTAMAIALPGGSAVAAAYGFQQFRTRGATRPVAAAVTLLCGAASVAGLAALYAGDALLRTGAVTAVAIAIPAAGLLFLSARRLRRADLPPAEEGSAPGRLGRLRHTIQETLLLAAVVPVRKWALVLTLAALNWLADLLCLLACLHAFGLKVSVPVVATAYLGAQLARQIPLTAAGIGVIEAELIVALTTAGAPVAAATAAVLAYRLLSCWLMLPVGAAFWSALRMGPAEPVPTVKYPRIRRGTAPRRAAGRPR